MTMSSKLGDGEPEAVPDAVPESAVEASRETARQAAEAAAEPSRVVAEWNCRMWGRRPGHREELELTDLVRAVAADGRLSLFDERGEPVTVRRPPRPVAAARPRPRMPRPAPAKIVRK